MRYQVLGMRYEVRPLIPRTSDLTLLTLGDRQEGLESLLLAPGALLRGRALLGLVEAPRGVLDALAQLAGVQLVGRDRLGDQHPCPIGEHLQPALTLRVTLGLALGEVQAKLRRHQAGDDRHVPGEDPDLAERRPG